MLLCSCVETICIGEKKKKVEEDVEEDKKGRRKQGRGWRCRLDMQLLKEKETLMLPSRSKIVRIGGREGPGDLTSIDTLLDGDWDERCGR